MKVFQCCPLHLKTIALEDSFMLRDFDRGAGFICPPFTGAVSRTLDEVEKTPLLKGRLEEKGATAITWLVLEACKKSGGVMERMVRYKALGILSQQDTEEEAAIERDRAELHRRVQDQPALVERVRFLRTELERIIYERNAEVESRKLTTNMTNLLKGRTKEQESAMQ
eukprot:625671-Rhodomonas_salina.2